MTEIEQKSHHDFQPPPQVAPHTMRSLKYLLVIGLALVGLYIAACIWQVVEGPLAMILFLIEVFLYTWAFLPEET